MKPKKIVFSVCLDLAAADVADLELWLKKEKPGAVITDRLLGEFFSKAVHGMLESSKGTIRRKAAEIRAEKQRSLAE